MADRQEHAHKDAQSAKAAQARTAYIKNFKRNAARHRQAFQQALRWEAMHKAILAARKSSRQPRVILFAFRAVSIIAVLAILGDVVMYNRWSSSRPLVTIGHRVITRREYQASLDTAAGKPVLSKLVFDELIQQAAAKAGVLPGAQDIDARLAERRRLMPGSIPAQDTPDLRAETGQALAMENLRLQGITATDAEVAAYYAGHQNEFSRPTQAVVTLVAAQNPVDAVEAAHLLTQDMPEPAIAAHPGLHVDNMNGFHVNLNALPPNIHAQLSQTVIAMKEGKIKTFRLGQTYLIVKMKTHTAGALLPLSQVREQVAREVKLQKAPTAQQTLISAYQANKPYFDMANYRQYFADIETAAGRPSAPAKIASRAQ